MKVIIRNIGSLYGTHNPLAPLRGKQLAQLPHIQNSFLHIENDLIAGFGTMDEMPESSGFEIIDANGGTIIPAWCDSHSHLVFARTRESEFVDKIKGLSYEEIARRGGGILNSALAIAEMPEEELYQLSYHRLQRASKLGTGAIEIKSGYGLDTRNELKMLRVIARLKNTSPMIIRSTFLGAHTFPAKYKNDRRGYIDLVIHEMIPEVARQKLADFIDVFCEQNFFTVEETMEICEAGMKYGMMPKIHANQLHVSGGVQTGVKLNAVSVDHLESMDVEAIQALSNSATIGTLLPTAAFFLRMNYQPARQLIDAGCAVALASDFNPGSSPGYNMNFVVALSCIQMKMLPEEAINAATINGAFAMGIGTEAGSIAVGKKANIILTEPINNIAALPYHFSDNVIKNVMIGGEWVQ